MEVWIDTHGAHCKAACYSIQHGIYFGKNMKIVNFFSLTPIVYTSCVYLVFAPHWFTPPIFEIDSSLLPKARYLNPEGVKEVMHTMTILLAIAFCSNIIGALVDYAARAKELHKLFDGKFYTFRTDFTKILISYFFGIFFASVALLSIIRKSHSVPVPFNADFIYVAVLVYIVASGIVEFLKYIPLFIFSISRR